MSADGQRTCAGKNASARLGRGGARPAAPGKRCVPVSSLPQAPHIKSASVCSLPEQLTRHRPGLLAACPAGSRAMFLLLISVFMPLPPTAAVVVHAASTLLTCNTSGYCRTVLLSHPLSHARQVSVFAALDVAALPLAAVQPIAGPLLAATSAPAPAGEAKLEHLHWRSAPMLLLRVAVCVCPGTPCMLSRYLLLAPARRSRCTRASLPCGREHVSPCSGFSPAHLAAGLVLAASSRCCRQKECRTWQRQQCVAAGGQAVAAGSGGI